MSEWQGNGTPESAWATGELDMLIDNTESLWHAKRRYIRCYQGAMTGESVEAFVREMWPQGLPYYGPENYDNVCWDELAESWENEDG